MCWPPPPLFQSPIYRTLSAPWGDNKGALPLYPAAPLYVVVLTLVRIYPLCFPVFTTLCFVLLPYVPVLLMLLVYIGPVSGHFGRHTGLDILFVELLYLCSSQPDTSGNTFPVFRVCRLVSFVKLHSLLQGHLFILVSELFKFRIEIHKISRPFVYLFVSIFLLFCNSELFTFLLFCAFACIFAILALSATVEAIQASPSKGQARQISSASCCLAGQSAQTLRSCCTAASQSIVSSCCRTWRATGGGSSIHGLLFMLFTLLPTGRVHPEGQTLFFPRPSFLLR